LVSSVTVRPLVTAAIETIAAWVTTLKVDTTNQPLPGRAAGELTKACIVDHPSTRQALTLAPDVHIKDKPRANAH
jgi:hypothetical protein